MPWERFRTNGDAADVGRTSEAQAPRGVDGFRRPPPPCRGSRRSWRRSLSRIERTARIGDATGIGNAAWIGDATRIGGTTGVGNAARIGNTTRVSDATGIRQAPRIGDAAGVRDPAWTRSRLGARRQQAKEERERQDSQGSSRSSQLDLDRHGIALCGVVTAVDARP